MRRLQLLIKIYSLFFYILVIFQLFQHKIVYICKIIVITIHVILLIIENYVLKHWQAWELLLVKLRYIDEFNDVINYNKK